MRPRATIVLALVFLALVNAPYVVAWVLSDGERSFRGLLVNVPDNANILAQMAESSRGGLAFQNPYGAPDAAPVYFHPVWSLAGLFIRATGASPLALFHALRIAAAIGIVAMALRLSMRRSPDGAVMAAVLALFGFGLDPLWRRVPVGSVLPPSLVAMHQTIPEATTVATCLIHAHLPVALLILLAVHDAAMRALVDGSARAAMQAAAWHAILAFVHPFDSVGVVAAIVGFLTTSGLRGELGFATLRLAAPVCLAPAPAALYFGWLSSAHRDLANDAHFHQPSPPPAVMANILGVTLLAGLFALMEGSGGTPRARRYLAAWLCGHLACAMARPFVPFERRLLMGCLFPAALLAGPWLQRLWQRGGRPRAIASLTLLAATLPAPMMIAELGSRLRQRPSPEFLSPGERLLRDEIGRRVGRGEVVMTTSDVGLDVPWISPGRAFFAYEPLTPDVTQRRELLARFFDPTTDDRERKFILKRNGVSWVGETGPRWRTGLATKDFLHLEADLGGARLYRVVPDHLRLGRDRGEPASEGDAP